MRRTIHFSISLLVLGILTAKANPVVLQHITDIKQDWSSEHQLYVKGDVPLSQNSLIQLETWLKDHPHWTVVLADTSNGETYQTPDGTEVHGNQAVSYMMGTGLPQTDEGTLTNAETRLGDGASLVILIKDHHLNYSASAEQEKFSVGTQNWLNNLDQPAIHDLRDGLRIVSAVKDTIALIDQKLAQNVAEMKKDFEAEVVASQSKLDAVQADLSAFQKNHPEATSQIYHPNLEPYRSAITSAVQQHDPGQVKQIDADLDMIEANLTTFNKIQDAYNDLAKQRPVNREGLDQVHKALVQGNFAPANQQIQIIRQDIEQQREAQDTNIAMGVLGGLLVMGLGFIILVCVLLKMWAVHSKRNQYLEKLKTWNAALTAKTDGLFDLDKGLECLALTPPDLMGSARKLYTGITLEMVLKALKTKDELYIMSSYLHDLYDKARAQVEKHPIQNWLFDKNYKKALNLLKSEPIRFQHNDPLRTLTQGNQKIDALLGRPEDYAEFTATADQLFDQFEALAKPTQQTIATLQKASETIQKGLAQIKKDQHELNGIPYASLNEETVTAQALQDPIGALNSIESQQQQITLLKETKQALDNVKKNHFEHLAEAQQRDLIQKRDEAETHLNQAEGLKAHDLLKAFERQRNIYQQEWQKAEDFTKQQPILHAHLQTEVVKNQDQPWTQPASIATVQGLLDQANTLAINRETEKSQLIYDQVSRIQTNWTTKPQDYVRAQMELERVKQQMQNSGVGQEYYQEAQQRFYQGDYSNTLVYSALALQAMEVVRLEMAREERMRMEQTCYDTPNYSNTDFSGSSSSSDSSSGSSWGSSDSGSSSSDFGSSDSGSSGSDW